MERSDVDDEFGWLTDPAARALFDDFPLPLAVAGNGAAAALTNRRFDHVLGAAALAGEPLRELLRNPDRQWRVVHVPRRDGSVLDAQAMPLPVRGGILLVIEESPDLLLRERIGHLHAHIARLERESSTDPLTGAWNRMHMDRILPGEIGKSLRARQPVSLVMLDIDHFKRVNDTFGHATGDSVLRELVRLAEASIRVSDLLFRWGGEEFIVLAPATGRTAATTLAEKLRMAVEAHAFPDVGRVTISLGVAEHAGGESPADWFARADAALYAAKDAGRNRTTTDPQGNSVAWATETGVPTLRLDWQEGYDCGHPVIDGQHRELFELANVLIDAALGRERDPLAFKAAFDRLTAHAAAHFRDEEAILATAGYPHLAGHARAHARLLARARELREAALAGQATFGQLVEYLAGDVVARHMLTADRDFYPLFAPAAARPA